MHCIVGIANGCKVLPQPADFALEVAELGYRGRRHVGDLEKALAHQADHICTPRNAKSILNPLTRCCASTASAWRSARA
jgi:hypothetical protein